MGTASRASALEPHLAQSGAERGAGRCDGLTVYRGLLFMPYA